VKVHYNSPAPVEVRARAYTQGAIIHVGPGQEQHLPHEAWHVVQQKQGRVKPTLQAKGVAINDDRGLEREAHEMGAKALRTNTGYGFVGAHAVGKRAEKGVGDPAPMQLASKKLLKAKGIIKLAGYKGAQETGPEGPVMIRPHSQIGGKDTHFSQYQKNYQDVKPFKIGTEYTDIMEAVFGGPTATKCHHLTQERTNKKGSKDNARYFKSGTWNKGTIHDDEDKIKGEMKKALEDERTRIVKVIERFE
jgi:hypothetical protein